MAPAAGAKIMADDFDVGGALNGVVSSLTTALPAIKDEATAKSALEGLTSAGATLDKVSGALGKVPADGKTALAGIAAAGLKALGPMIDTALGNSAASAVVKPALDGIKDKLTALAKG
jgi:hypothetical protein